MAPDVAQQPGEGGGGDQVGALSPEPSCSENSVRVDLHRVDEEAPLDREALLPRAGPAEPAAELLEQGLGEEVLAGIEDREDPVPERAAT